MASNLGAVLETRELSIRFGGHLAVDAVSCAFYPGTLTAIVGPNGAGKTTYFNLISGQLKASAGRVLFHGIDITALPPSQRARRGLGRAFQLTNLFPYLSVHENVRLAVQSRRGAGLDLLHTWRQHTELIEEADDVIRQVGLAARRDVRAGLLRTATSASSTRLPDRAQAADLSVRRTDRRHERRRGAGYSRSDPGPSRPAATRTILLVEHKMDVVRSLADRIVVLHNGELVPDGDPASVIALPVVQEAYLGVANV